jgi:glycosyltransferase involved in cell wall biosynthesis
MVLGSRARTLRLDIVHSLGYLSPLRLDTKSVVTILDMVHYLHPNDIPRSKRYLWQLLLPTTLRRVDRIITISESVKRDLAQLFPRAALKAVAVPLAVDRSVFHPDPMGSVERRGADGTRTVLAVASMSPHKNLEVLVRAVSQLRHEGATLRLLLVGRESRTSLELQRLAEDLGVADVLEFAGHVPEETLVRLYREAAVMVFPSLYEGFGLPPLEAMACGCPVIASSASSIPEVVGDAALFFDPRDPTVLAGHLRTVLGSDEVRASLVTRGFENVARFSWATTAARTLGVYADVLAFAKA